MPDPSPVRVEVAFDGGQSIGVLVSPEVADAFQRALAEGADGVFELEADDGRYLLPLRRIVFVKRFARDTRIGFAEIP